MNSARLPVGHRPVFRSKIPKDSSVSSLWTQTWARCFVLGRTKESVRSNEGAVSETIRVELDQLQH